MATDYDSLIAQAQANGQAATADYTNKANQASSDYSNYQGQASQANNDIKNLNDYMAGAGSATNLYNNALTAQQAQTGYSQQQLQAAQQNLSQANGSLSAYNDFANTAASKWGLNAGGFAAANASAQGSINNNISAASQSLKNQQDAFTLAQTGANQQAGLGLQQQQQQLAGYTQVYNNALAQQTQSQQNMQFYQNLAQQQGGLTAQQVQMYANSKQLNAQATAALASAQAAIAQAKLATSQATGQDISNQQAQAYGNSQAYQNYLNSGNTTGVAPSTAASASANGNGSNWLTDTIQNGANSWGTTFKNNGLMTLLGKGTFWS